MSSNEIKDVSMNNTKKELLAAYEELKKELTNKAKNQLKPEIIKQEKENQELIKKSDELTNIDIQKHIEQLKKETLTTLNELAEKMELQSRQYIEIKKAIQVKETELKDIYGIEKTAHELAALIEAHKEKKVLLEEEYNKKKNELNDEIIKTKEIWEKEKKLYEQSLKEKESDEKKRKEREKEEFHYQFEREKEQKINLLNDELNKLQKEINENKSIFESYKKDKEKELKERESIVKEQETLFLKYQSQVEKFPQLMESEVSKQVKQEKDNILKEFEKNEALIKKEYEGKENVLTTKIDSLEKTIKEQAKQIDLLSKQLENAYGKIQEILISN